MSTVRPATHDPSLSADSVGRLFDVILSADIVGYQNDDGQCRLTMVGRVSHPLDRNISITLCDFIRVVQKISVFENVLLRLCKCNA